MSATKQPLTPLVAFLASQQIDVLRRLRAEIRNAVNENQADLERVEAAIARKHRRAGGGR